MCNGLALKVTAANLNQTQHAVLQAASVISVRYQMQSPRRSEDDARQSVLHTLRSIKVRSLSLASCLIYSYALIEYINRFAVDGMVTYFFVMLYLP